mgnify:CR=1 FL=1
MGRLDIFSAGINLIHFSNGRTRTPNKGMNLIGAKMGVIHYFRRAAGMRRTLPFDRRTTAAVVRSSSPSFPESHTFFWNMSLATGFNSTNRGSLVERRADFIEWGVGGVAETKILRFPPFCLAFFGCGNPLFSNRYLPPRNLPGTENKAPAARRGRWWPGPGYRSAA